MKGTRGFTMIELLIVVAVIAILAGIAVPNFLEAQTRAKVARTRADMAVLDAALRAYAVDTNSHPPNTARLAALLAPQAADPELTLPDWLLGTIPVVEQATVEPEQEVAFDPLDDMMGGGFLGMDFWDGGAQPGEIDWNISEAGREFAALLIESGEALVVLTTPVAYLTTRLPEDSFCDTLALDDPRPGRAFLFPYINRSALAPEGGDSPAARRYLLLSWGPDKNAKNPADLDANLVHGVPIAYDPTNGTVSPGNIFSLGN